jgi:hypothetical protein
MELLPKLKTKYDELTNHVFDMHVKAVNIRSKTKMFRSNKKDLDILHGENHFFPSQSAVWLTAWWNCLRKGK